jgi:two-component system response regulator PilR (NtrC family)
MNENLKILVLVADDNAGIRDTTAAILRAVGYTVTEAPDGQVAMEELDKKVFDVVLLDVQMPRQDGIAVVESLIAQAPPPVIMMVSAYDFDTDLRDHLNQRVFKYLKKPVPPKDLIEAVGLAARL